MPFTRADLVEALRNELAVSNIEAKEFLNLVFVEISQFLKDGQSVHLSSFGNFDLIKKNVRMGRNPRTGDEIEIPTRCVISFRPSRKLKNTINNSI